MANRVGRPTLLTDELVCKAYEYIEECPDIVPSVVGLCVHIGVAKTTIYRWIEEDCLQFKDILGAISELQELKLITGGLTSEFNPTITKMMMTKHGYSDKLETDVTSNGKTLNNWSVNPVTTNKDSQ
jgi:hypothetical protein